MNKINHRDGNFSVDIIREKLYDIVNDDHKAKK